MKKKVNNYFTDFTDEISQQVNEDYKKIEKEFFPLEKWYTTKEIVGLLKEHTPPVNDEGIPYLYTVNKQTAKERMLHTDLVDKSFYLDYTEKRVGEIIKNDILGIDELYEEGEGHSDLRVFRKYKDEKGNKSKVFSTLTNEMTEKYDSFINVLQQKQERLNNHYNKLSVKEKKELHDINELLNKIIVPGRKPYLVNYNYYLSLRWELERRTGYTLFKVETKKEVYEKFGKVNSLNDIVLGVKKILEDFKLYLRDKLISFSAIRNEMERLDELLHKSIFLSPLKLSQKYTKQYYLLKGQLDTINEQKEKLSNIKSDGEVFKGNVEKKIEKLEKQIEEDKALSLSDIVEHVVGQIINFEKHIKKKYQKFVDEIYEILEDISYKRWEISKNINEILDSVFY